MKINYKLFTKHAEKVAKTASGSRPILQGIHHDDGGTVTITDAFRMYQARNVNAPRNAILHAITGEDITDKHGNYPDASRLIPEEGNAKTVLHTGDVATLKGTLKAMQMATTATTNLKKAEQRVRISDGKLTAETSESVSFTYELNVKEGDENGSVLLSLPFMLEAVEMFEDMGADNLTVRMYGPNRPIRIDPEGSDDLTAIVMPIRM